MPASRIGYYCSTQCKVVAQYIRFKTYYISAARSKALIIGHIVARTREVLHFRCMAPDAPDR